MTLIQRFFLVTIITVNTNSRNSAAHPTIKNFSGKNPVVHTWYISSADIRSCSRQKKNPSRLKPFLSCSVSYS